MLLIFKTGFYYIDNFRICIYYMGKPLLTTRNF